MSGTSESRRIFLRNFSVEASIGIHAHEKAARQRLLINVEIFLHPEQAVQDDIGEVLDYDFLRRGILGMVAARHYNLQETLCQQIVEFCLGHAQVLSARVSTEKPDVYPDCDGVGYEIFRQKS